MVVQFLRQWKSLSPSSKGFATSPGQWRSLFNKALDSLQLTSFQFRPCGLRRGRATWWFGRHHSLDKILVEGRWQAPRTARIYLNEGLSVPAELQLPATLPSLAPFLKVFSRFRSHSFFETLEPSGLKPERPGGRGKRPMKRPKKRKGGTNASFLKICGLSQAMLTSGMEGLAQLHWGIVFVYYLLCEVAGLAGPSQRKKKNGHMSGILFLSILLTIKLRSG